MLDLDELLNDAKNEFKICERCKGTNIQSLVPKLQKLDEHADIIIGCHSYCGPGRESPFAFVNNRPIRGKTEDELIHQIADFLKN